MIYCKPYFVVVFIIPYSVTWKHINAEKEVGGVEENAGIG